MVRPRRYFALCAITTTSASRAPISPRLLDQVVLPVAHGAEAEQQPGARAAYPVHDLQQRLEARLVVREVDDHADVVAGEEVHPAGVVLGVGTERRQPLDHGLAGQPDAERRRRGAERVLDVEAGQPGQRHRDVDDLDQRVRVAVGVEHRRASRR